MNLIVALFTYAKQEWLFTTGYPKRRSVGLFDLSHLQYIWDYSLAVFNPVKNFLCGPSEAALATWHHTIVTTLADLQVFDIVALSCNRKSVVDPGIELVVSFISFVPLLSHDICKFTKRNVKNTHLPNSQAECYIQTFYQFFLRREGQLN